MKINRIGVQRNAEGDFCPDMPIGEIRDRVAEGEVFICKGVIPRGELDAVKKAVFERYQDEPPELLPYSWGQRDHWRLDDNPPRSSISKCLSLYFNFIWNETFPEILSIARALGQFRNAVAGLPEEYGFRREDPYWVVPTIQHHPSGGGFIDGHSDPIEPDGCVVSLFMSTRGVDYQSGGLFVDDGNGQHDLEDELEAGDLFIFRPNIVHGVDPVDPGRPPEFFDLGGRWRMAAVLSPAVAS